MNAGTLFCTRPTRCTSLLAFFRWVSSRHSLRMGKRILMMTLQIESDGKISFVFHGATWPFRSRFDAAAVPGYSYEDEGQQKYFRVLESFDTTTEEDRDRVIHVLGDGVLRNTATRVTIEGELRPGTHAFRFVQTLRKRTHLHFV